MGKNPIPLLFVRLILLLVLVSATPDFDMLVQRVENLEEFRLSSTALITLLV
jgi:hypothetical protein